MLVLSNHAADYRNWAYCCVAIRKLTEKLNSYAAGKVTDISEYYRIKSSGRNAYNDYCSRKCQEISRRLARYICLQEKLAAGLDSPEKHLLQIEDMLNLIGNVIEVTPRHSRNRAFLALNECSTDGSQVNGFDAFELLAYGYGKSV